MSDLRIDELHEHADSALTRLLNTNASAVKVTYWCQECETHHSHDPRLGRAPGPRGPKGVQGEPGIEP